MKKDYLRFLSSCASKGKIQNTLIKINFDNKTTRRSTRKQKSNQKVEKKEIFFWGEKEMTMEIGVCTSWLVAFLLCTFQANTQKTCLIETWFGYIYI